MKSAIISVFTLVLLSTSISLRAQDKSITPSIIISGKYLGETPPLRDIPTLTDAEWHLMVEKAERKELNPKLESRSYPFAETALPKGPDPAWQRQMGSSRESRAPIINFDGQNSPYYPPDANGTVGPNHYMQTINTVYAIYNKAGTLVAGPANMNTLFSGVTGSECNNGDPIVLYDEQADRWLAAEFSLCGATDYMLIAVSTTNDPTGTWHKYSFDVDDMPDYEKFGIWRDGYYMGTNNSSGDDIYVFERSQMLIGETAQMVGFNNAWRPTTIDGFMCVPPLDNDGDFAPAGEPGLFITINDDAIGGGSDQLWIYELDVDWTTPANSTFARTQTIDVSAFDSNFGNTWDNIKQLGTNDELDAIPQVVMNPPQYRNFGTYETILCCHTVDVDDTDHAGIRWYELRRDASGIWIIRQEGTYAPDEHSRWMGSIMLNGNNEIGLAYSISSTAMYPGIRYCGQSAAAYTVASGILDVSEDIIQAGAYSQTGPNRWGDYSALQVDPTDDETFWFTTEYIGSGGTRKTRIASFQIGPVALNANFSASNTTPLPNTSVTFNDLSAGGVVSWSWSFSPNTVTFLGGTSEASQNPQVSFNNSGYYTVSLEVGDGSTTVTETKDNYIHAFTPGYWTGVTSTNWNTASNWDGSYLPTTGTNVTIPTSAPNWPVFTGDLTLGSHCNNLFLTGAAQMSITGSLTISFGQSLVFNGNGELSIGGDWVSSGTFTPGTGTIKFTGATPASVIAYSSASDISTYQRETFTKSMTALTGATSGPTGDNGNQNISIGFTFNYAGTAYTQAKISTNGWLSLNLTGTLGYVNSVLFDNSAPNATVAPWWDDLEDDGTSFVYYKTEGSAPDQIFTVEWLHVLSFKSGATARINFQAKLYETTNAIEFHYGTVESGNHNGNESASIGIEDATGGIGHFIEATTGSSTTGVTNLKSATNWPTINYRFTPPAITQSFHNVIVNKSGTYVEFNTDTEVDGTFDVMPGASFNVKNGLTLTVVE